MSLESNFLSVIEDRARMLEAVRSFFRKRNILEVDTPILSKSACIDVHIALMSPLISTSLKGFLHSSPEYGMKKLLCKLRRDIFQLSHVFRQGEIGPYHRPEFTMIEWYLVEQSLDTLINQTLELISLFIPFKNHERTTYEKVLENKFRFNPFEVSQNTLFGLSKKNGFETKDKDAAMSFLWDIAEKDLGSNGPCVVEGFFAADSQLSKSYTKDGKDYCERFEIYYQGVELANGYNELLDPIEHKKRFKEISLKRQSLNLESLPIDTAFLNLLDKGLPSCVGVAVGFDRLMMLRHNTDNIEHILPLTWEET